MPKIANIPIPTFEDIKEVVGEFTKLWTKKGTEESKIRAMLATYKRKLNDEMAKPNPDEKKIAEYENKIAELQERLQKIIEQNKKIEQEKEER